MSKKILKRSLALGALMAFVITGSAMAAQTDNLVLDSKDGWYKDIITEDTVYVDDVKLNDNDHSNRLIKGTSGKEIVYFDGTAVNTGFGKDNDAARTWARQFKIENVGKIVFRDQLGNHGFSAMDGNGGQDAGKITITNVGSIEQEDGSYVEVVFQASGGHIDVNVGSMSLNNFANAIYSQTDSSTYGGTVSITASDDIRFESANTSAVVSASNMDTKTKALKNTVNLNAKNIYITSPDAVAVRAIGYFDNTAGNCEVVLDATNKIEINAKTAVLAQNGYEKDSASVMFKANEIILNGSEYAINANKNGKVSLDAATANIRGVISVDGTSTLDLSKVKDLVLEGLEAGNADAAIKVEKGGTLNVNTSGTLEIDKAEVGTYKVVDGVGSNEMWANENLAYDRTALFAEGTVVDNVYSVTYTTADQMTDEQKETAGKEYIAATGGEELAVPDLVGSAAGAGSIMENTAPGAQKFLAAVSSDAEMPKETKAAVINSAAKLAEAGGNAGTAVSVANNVAGVTTGRISFGGRGHGGHKGGHGVGMFEEGSGAAVWAQYMHGKDDATDMPMDGGATSYESEYDGIVVGVDFKKVGKFQSGIAFNYGEGDSNGFGSGIKTSSEYDFWGVGYYGNIRNEDTNFIFDVNYAKSDSDVTQNNPAAREAIEASPETTTWSAGVKVEKLYQNNNVQIVPYTGLRYMSIDTDEYQSNIGGDTLFNYAPERQDIWLLPLGVTIKQEVVNDNGWVVTPKVDLSYIWAFGDTDSNMSVSIPGIAASNDTLGFTVMDDGSFLGLVGVEAKLDDWTFGVSYSYQKGDYAESKKWFVDAKYSF